MIPPVFALSLSALLPPALGQEPTRSASRADIEASARDLLDSTVAIAGDEVVLQRDLTLVLYSSTFRERFERSKTDPAAYNKLVEEALQLRLQDLITVQAGRTLGFDPELVEDMTDRTFQDDVEANGGPKTFSDRLRRSYLTPQDYRSQIRDSLLGNAWRRSISGHVAGPTGRTAVDRYVSPGWLFAAYEDLKRSPSARERELVGIQMERLVLRRLMIAEAEYPDAQSLARVIREQVEAGADMGELVQQYEAEAPSRGRQGLMLQPLPLDFLREVSQTVHGGSELYEALRSAEAGTCAGPFPVSAEGRAGWCIYRLEERLPATEALPFDDPGMQRRLRIQLQRQLDDLRVERAFRRVLDQTYIHPEPMRSILERSGGQRSR